VQELDVEQRFHLMQKEIEAAVSILKDTKLDLTAAVDSLKIELEAMKTFMERHHSGFAESYARLKEEAIQAIDPEWLTEKGN
jgi:hypothetical protein